MQHDVFPLEQQEDFFKKKDISVIEKYSTAVMHTWGRLPLLPVWNNFSKIYKTVAVFVSFRESLDLRLELIYMMYGKLTLGRLIYWT